MSLTSCTVRGFVTANGCAGTRVRSGGRMPRIGAQGSRLHHSNDAHTQILLISPTPVPSQSQCVCVHHTSKPKPPTAGRGPPPPVPPCYDLIRSTSHELHLHTACVRCRNFGSCFLFINTRDIGMTVCSSGGSRRNGVARRARLLRQWEHGCSRARMSHAPLACARVRQDFADNNNKTLSTDGKTNEMVAGVGRQDDTRG